MALPHLGAQRPLMQVREAARVLGIHENTLRRWEEAGRIRAVKLPTGVRRFRFEDIARLHDEMFEGFASTDSTESSTVGR